MWAKKIIMQSTVDIGRLCESNFVKRFLNHHEILDLSNERMCTKTIFSIWKFPRGNILSNFLPWKSIFCCIQQKCILGVIREFMNFNFMECISKTNGLSFSYEQGEITYVTYWMTFNPYKYHVCQIEIGRKNLANLIT